MNGIGLPKKIRRVYSGGLWRHNVDTIENMRSEKMELLQWQWEMRKLYKAEVH